MTSVEVMILKTEVGKDMKCHYVTLKGFDVVF